MKKEINNMNTLEKQQRKIKFFGNISYVIGASCLGGSFLVMIIIHLAFSNLDHTLKAIFIFGIVASFIFCSVGMLLWRKSHKIYKKRMEE